MSLVTTRSAEACRYDLLALGEVMLRLDPGEDRVRMARRFRAWEGGGEYNVARGLARCFRMRTGVATALAENEVGLLIADLIRQGGVDMSLVKWVPYDGIGYAVRNGLNFTERGYGVRGAIGCSDRGHTAASQIKPGNFDWDQIFGESGVRWFHTGGIFAGLSASTAAVVIEAAISARQHGTIVSYDLNYRPSLWQRSGGLEQCRAVNREMAAYVDVLFGGAWQLATCLGYELADGKSDADNFRQAASRAATDFGNLRVVAGSLRKVHSASVNDWGGVCWIDGRTYLSGQRSALQILDTVGGGDGFASGMVYGMMTSDDPQWAVELGAAHGALVMTTPGDNSSASVEEVEALARGADAHIDR